MKAKKIKHVFIPFGSDESSCTRCGRAREGHMTDKEYKRYTFWYAVGSLTILFSTLIAFWGTVALVGYLAMVGMEQRCKTNATEMGAEYRYDILSGCRIGVDGKFVNWEILRYDAQ